MSRRSWSNTDAQLLRGEGPGLATGHTVAVGEHGMNAGFLDAGNGRRAVRLCPAAELTADQVVIGEQLADELGLSGQGEQAWTLTPAEATPAATLVLETMTEGDLDGLARQLKRATDVAGQVCWLDEDASMAWIHVDGTPFRVRQALGADGRPVRGLMSVDPRTEIQLFAPNSRTGVDIVVLADCSGSMSWDDIVDSGEMTRARLGAQSRYITRMGALKRALTQMLEIRTQVTGRVSRIALVAFTTTARCVFPRQEAMAEIEGPEDVARIDQFRSAIGLLKHQDAGTDIGKALHYGADLLYRHGVPDNDRLIVLVSDGADWAPKGVDSTGEALAATDDPVSLMDELHRTLNVKLHAIGIGDEATFHQWWNINHRRTRGEPHVSTVPNHRLLKNLLEVGGGDPGRIGGLDVLEDYFADLGAGVSHRVGRPSPVTLPRLQGRRTVLTSVRKPVDAAAEQRRRQLADEAQTLRYHCIRLSIRCGQEPVYQDLERADDLLRLGRAVVDEDSFKSWIGNAWQGFEESLHRRLNRQPKPGETPDALTPIRELVRDGRLDHIRRLRNYVNHYDPSPDNEAVVGAILHRHVGVKFLPHDDADGWSRLQLGLLAELVALLREMYALLQAMPVPEKADAVVAFAPPIEGY